MQMDTDQETGQGSEDKTALYRHLDKNGRLLYVGISLDATARLKDHMHVSSWKGDIAMVVISWFETRKEALDAEKKAIVNERPLYNKVHGVDKPKRRATIDSPDCRPIVLLKDRPIGMIPKRVMRLVVDAIYRCGDAGAAPRDIQVAMKKYLTANETNDVIDWLLNDGIVREVVRTTSRGGRPGRKLVADIDGACAASHLSHPAHVAHELNHQIQ